PGVGDRWPRRADQVEDPTPDLRYHGIGRGEAPHTHHWPGRQLLDLGDVALLEPLLRNPGAHGIVFHVRDIHVPQVRELGQQRYHFPTLAFEGDAPLAHQLVHGKPDSDRAFVADGFLRHLDHLAQQTHAVDHAAAIFVAAPVPALRNELEWQ